MPDYLIAGCTAAAMALAGLTLIIPVLRRFNASQFVRDDGPESHLAKSGTPTMGGGVLMLTLPASMVFADGATKEALLAIYLALAMGALGFIDDFLMIRRRHSEGLTSRQKMAGQVIIASLFAVAHWWWGGGSLWAPMIGGYVDLGVFYIPLAVFVITATVNGVNFTDGVDGLCAGVTFLVAVAFLLLCRSWALTRLTWFAAALAGSCLGFLCFNLHPARVFMGDTGSLAMGGAVAALALLTETALLLPVLGAVYVAEVASVILQVRYFKFTGGKRFFRMAPIHHHFELCGWSESKVDIVFWAVTAIAALFFLWVLL